MSPEAEAWAIAAREGATRSNVRHLSIPLLDAIEDLLRGQLSSSETAQIVTTHLAPAIRSEPQGWNYSNSRRRIWTMIGNAARAFGKVQTDSEKPADLVISIASTEELPRDDERHGFFAAEAIYWKDLPYFALEVREEIAPEWFNGLGLDEERDLEVPWQTQAEPLLNATTFIGALLNRLSLDAEPLLWTIWLCLDSSEVIPELEVEFPIDQDYLYVEERLDQRSHFITVASAATMILIAGERIWGICRLGRTLRDGRRFDEERWGLWKRSFAARSGVSAFPDEVRALCEQAFGRMETFGKELRY